MPANTASLSEEGPMRRLFSILIVLLLLLAACDTVEPEPEPNEPEPTIEPGGVSGRNVAVLVPTILHAGA